VGPRPAFLGNFPTGVSFYHFVRGKSPSTTPSTSRGGAVFRPLNEKPVFFGGRAGGGGGHLDEFLGEGKNSVVGEFLGGAFAGGANGLFVRGAGPLIVFSGAWGGGGTLGAR